MKTQDNTQSDPVRDDLSGRWSHTSFLLDPSSVTPGEDPKAMPQSVARIWAKGTLDLKETRQSGERDTLKGELKFEPSGLILQVRGRRVPDIYGNIEGIVFEGTGSIPGPAGHQIDLKYDLVGTLSPDWRQGHEELTITGSIRAKSFDPRAPSGTVGAFVLAPLGDVILESS